jgi:hypothetical protein
MSAEPSEQAADPGRKRSNENTFLSLTQKKKKTMAKETTFDTVEVAEGV